MPDNKHDELRLLLNSIERSLRSGYNGYSTTVSPTPDSHPRLPARRFRIGFWQQPPIPDTAYRQHGLFYADDEDDEIRPVDECDWDELVAIVANLPQLIAAIKANVERAEQPLTEAIATAKRIETDLRKDRRT